MSEPRHYGAMEPTSFELWLQEQLEANYRKVLTAFALPPDAIGSLDVNTNLAHAERQEEVCRKRFGR